MIEPHMPSAKALGRPRTTNLSGVANTTPYPLVGLPIAVTAGELFTAPEMVMRTRSTGTDVRAKVAVKSTAGPDLRRAPNSSA